MDDAVSLSDAVLSRHVFTQAGHLGSEPAAVHIERVGKSTNYRASSLRLAKFNYLPTVLGVARSDGSSPRVATYGLVLNIPAIASCADTRFHYISNPRPELPSLVATKVTLQSGSPLVAAEACGPVVSNGSKEAVRVLHVIKRLLARR